MPPWRSRYALAVASLLGAGLVGIGALLADVGAGWASLVVGVVAFVVAVPRGTLLTRIFAFGVLVAAVLLAAGLVGPLVPQLFGPAALGALVCLPGGVAVMLPRQGLRPQWPQFPADEMTAVVMTGIAGWLFATPFIGKPMAAQLEAMTSGGGDYLAHFDYMQNAWFHKGFLFVHAHHHILEPRPLIAATPYGAHVVMAAIGILLTHDSALPPANRLFRLFVGFDVASGVVLAGAAVTMTSRLLRFSRVPTWMRSLAVIAVGSAVIAGSFGGLYVFGFITFTVGLALTATALVFAVTSRRRGWVADGAVVTAAIVAGCFTYTLMIPALLLAFLLYLWRTRHGWYHRRHHALPAAVYSVVVVGALIASVVPVIASNGAADVGGGIDPVPRGLLFLVGFGSAAIAIAARHRLTKSVLQLSWVGATFGAIVVAFAGVQIVRVGKVSYYAEKTAYLWLLIALIALVAEVCVLSHPMVHHLSRPWRLAAGICATLAVLLSNGYFGPGASAVTPKPTAAPPVVRWLHGSVNAPGLYEKQLQAAQVVLAQRRPHSNVIRVLWGPWVTTPRNNRWLAVLDRRWKPPSDALLAKLSFQYSNCLANFEDWLRKHPHEPVLVLATRWSWVRTAKDAVAAAGARNVVIQHISDRQSPGS